MPKMVNICEDDALNGDYILSSKNVDQFDQFLGPRPSHIISPHGWTFI